MKHSKNYTRKLSLAYSVMILLVLLVLFSSVLIILFREQYKREVDTQAEFVSKIKEQTDSSLQGMDRIINGLLFNQEFTEIMRTKDPSRHYITNNKSVLNSFVALDAPLFSTHRIIAFDKEVYYTLSKTGEDQLHIKQAIQNYEEWQRVIDEDGSRVIFPVYDDPFEPGEQYVYAVSRSITDGRNSYGIIEVQNSYTQMEDLCQLDARLGQVAVFSAAGEVIYPFPDIDEAVEELFQEALSQQQDQGNFILHGQQASFARSEYSDWMILLYNPVSNIVPYAFQLIVATLIAFLGLSGISLVSIQIVTKRLMSPLTHLNEAVTQVSLDNLSLSLPESGGIREIESINQSFEEMFAHLKEAIAASIQARAGEERANFLALQSQMNPHTIYNTIAMIESVSYMNGDREVSELCVSFSNMLRYISDFTKREYTVQDEVSYLESYNRLISKRYEGRLESTVMVAEPGLRKKILPKFTLQPLVENAVKHGLKCNVESLHITVEVVRQSGSWYIIVEDNGRGFSDESLAEIHKQLKGCDESLGNNGDVVNQKIGNLSMSNIYIRCRILYGEAFEFSLGNNTQGGAFVKLLIPDKEEERGGSYENISG